MLACAGFCLAQANYVETLRKANRFFDNREWASAAALYTFALHERPAEGFAYGRAIVSNQMLGDSAVAMHLLDQAMSYGVPLDSVLTNVKRASFDVGSGSMYEDFLLAAAVEHPWLSRPLDAYLLRYYAFRRNGPMMIKYAHRMLNGAPVNPYFLSVLADGYMSDGQTDKAIETWRRIVQVYPDNYEALLHLGNYYYMQDDRTNALTYLMRAQEIKSTPYVASLLDKINHPKKS